MRNILLLSIAFLPWIALSQETGSSETVEKPNVLFLISDDLDCRIGCYGDPVAKTPNIDRLAGMGVKFDRAYCQFPLCSPSRCSVLTGRYPTTTGILDNHIWLIPGEGREILPDYFAGRGYDVKMYGKIFHGPNTGFKEGEQPERKNWVTPEQRMLQKKEDPGFWDRNHSPYRHMELSDPTIYAGANEFGPLSDSASKKDWHVRRDSASASKAIMSLREFSEGDQPFFLAVGFHKPHVPLKAPAKYFDLYEPWQMQLPPDFNTEPIAPPGYPAYEFRKNIDLYAGRPFTVAEARKAMLAYYACVSYMDAQLGRVLDELERLGLEENTIIVFWGDHGWHLSEKGMWAKGTLFEVSARGPMIIVDPRSKASGSSSPRVVQYLDIFPTLVDLCGLPPSTATEGRSLRPLVYDPDTGWDHPAFTVQTRRWSLGRSVRTEQWRYTEWDGGQRGAALFDHDSDPHEMTNLASDPAYESVVAEMKKLLEQLEIQ